ncbi:hypothetical protein C8Q77DRAFT_432098 [Trametes polyzona]|nr:hypothetical protein C8Q77DRAFT_432098 [Trametes polyzona]
MEVLPEGPQACTLDLKPVSLPDEDIPPIIHTAASPEFASNFAIAQLPSKVYCCSASSLSFASFYSCYLEDDAVAQSEEFTEPLLGPDVSVQSLCGLPYATPYVTALDFFDDPFDPVSDDQDDEDSTSDSVLASVSPEEGEDTAVQANKQSECAESPRDPFEEVWLYAKALHYAEIALRKELPKIIITCSSEGALWQGMCTHTRQLVEARTFAEGVPELEPWLRTCGQGSGEGTGKGLAGIDSPLSEDDDPVGRAELWTPSELDTRSVFSSPFALGEGLSSIPTFTSYDDDECSGLARSTFSLTDAGPDPEGVAQAAREAFWEPWTRPSDADLAWILERREDTSIALTSFVEEASTPARPLPGDSQSGSAQPPVDRPLAAREWLKQELRHSSIALWEETTDL